MPQQQIPADWLIPAEERYFTMGGVFVRKGQTRAEAEANAEEQRFWRAFYGSPEYGGWVIDSYDGRHKPRQCVKGVAQ